MSRRLACLVLLAAVFAGCRVTPAPLPPTSGPVSSGAPMTLRLPRYPSGQAFDLIQDRGSVVLLDVWATWCEPCRDALPVYEALLKQYGPRGLRVYAINVDADPKQIGPFVSALQVALPILVDKDAAVAERELHVKVMPTTFIVDKRGVVRHVHEGFLEESLMQFQTEIESLLAEPAQ